MSTTVPAKNSGGPSVGERTIESPLSITGAPWRQNGPSRFADVGCSSVPLFIRHTSVDRPRLPAISRTSLWLGVVSWPSLATTLTLASNSASVSRTSRAKSCRWRMSACTISRNRGSSARPVSARTASVSCISSLMIMCVSYPAADGMRCTCACQFAANAHRTGTGDRARGGPGRESSSVRADGTGKPLGIG